jgi:2'-5' RNA ligase
MRLHVAIVPPEDVLGAVADVVRNADAPVEAPPPPGRRSLLGRRGRGAAPSRSVAALSLSGRELDHLPTGRMLLPLANFGNVTVADAGRISRALRDAATTLAAPTLYLAGSAALEFPGDLSVWARVNGDTDALKLIAPAITRSVEHLGFFVDRRLFRSMLAVATVTDTTSVEVLQQVVDALDAFRGDPWTVGHVSLMVRRLDHDPPDWEEIEQIPLASAAQGSIFRQD